MQSSPGRSISLTDTPEFKAAVDAAVAAALSRFEPPQATPASGDNSTQVIDRLAVTLGKMVNSTGIGQNYVDPEITARRKDAHRKMRELLGELLDRGDKPKWKLVGQVHMPLGDAGYAIINPLYRDANKRQKPTEISFYGEPNLAMRPINRPAEQVWDLYCASIGRNAAGDSDDEVDDGLGEMALTISGAVVRGNAAAVARKHDPAADDAVTIEHGDDPAKRKVRIFTAMPPVEMG